MLVFSDLESMCIVADVAFLSQLVKMEPTSSDLTVEKCKKYCFEANNHQFAGVYNGEDYYCTSQGQEPQIKPRTECNKKCPGNPHQACGGLDRMNVFSIKGESFENEHCNVNI